MSSLESYLLEKSNKRGNKNLNQIRSFFSDNDLTTVYICDECIELCVEIIDEEKVEAEKEVSFG